MTSLLLITSSGSLLLTLAVFYLLRENRYQSMQINALKKTIHHKDDYITLLLAGRPDADAVRERLRLGQL